MLKSALALFLFSATVAQADIVIGVAGPLSGPMQPFGQALLNGVKAAVDKLNAQGGLGREQLIVVTADDQCDTVKAREAADKLIGAQVDVVIGHFCSLSALEGAKAYDKAGLTMIAPTSTLPAITESGLANVIRLSTRADAQGAFAATRILARRPNAKLALLDDGTAEMKAITASFTATYGKVPTLAASLIPEQKDFTEILAKLKSANIDTLFIAASPTDAGRLTAQSVKAGLDLKRYGPDTLLAEPFWASAGAAGENTLVSFPADPENNSEAKALSKEFKVLGQVTDGPFLPAYAAVQLFAGAAEVLGAHSHSGIASALKARNSFPTIMGPMRFDAKGDNQDLRFSWYSWNNGVYQTIAPEVP